MCENIVVHIRGRSNHPNLSYAEYVQCDAAIGFFDLRLDTSKTDAFGYFNVVRDLTSNPPIVRLLANGHQSAAWTRHPQSASVYPMDEYGNVNMSAVNRVSIVQRGVYVVGLTAPAGGFRFVGRYLVVIDECRRLGYGKIRVKRLGAFNIPGLAKVGVEDAWQVAYAVHVAVRLRRDGYCRRDTQ